MPSLIRKESNDLFVYRNEREFPIKGSSMTAGQWFITSERIQVSFDDGPKFWNLILEKSKGRNPNDVAKEGIFIPDDCYEVEATTYHIGNCGFGQKQCNCKEERFAYFSNKDREVKKETLTDCPTCGNRVRTSVDEHGSGCFLPDRPQERISPEDHAIEFATWICKRGFDSKQITLDEPRWCNGPVLTTRSYTTSELYKEFISRK